MILVLAFGALVAAILPLLIGFLAITISLTIIGVIADYTPMSVFVLNLTTMIGLGVGIDYSLLVVTRFREELTKGTGGGKRRSNTFSTAGMAVLTSGLTVVVGFGALILTPLVETRSVGIAGLIVVAVAVLLSTTLLPALLAMIGREIDRPRWLARRLTWYHSPRGWEKWARTLARNPGRALPRWRGRDPHRAALLDPDRAPGPPLVARPAPRPATGSKCSPRSASPGISFRSGCWSSFPRADAVDATSLRGLSTLSDSLRADPRVRDVQSLVNLTPGQPAGLFPALHRPRLGAGQYPDLLDAYLSSDGGMTLIDVILADTTSLTTAMDVVVRARELGRGAAPGHRGA